MFVPNLSVSPTIRNLTFTRRLVRLANPHHPDPDRPPATAISGALRAEAAPGRVRFPRPAAALAVPAAGGGVRPPRAMDRSRALDRDEVEKFVASLSSLPSAIPDELVRHYLSRAGFATDDVRLERLIALAAQKFIADVAHDAISHSRLRQVATAPPTKKKIERDPRIVLTVDDLERALREYGVTFRKPPYFADSVTAGAPDPAPSKPQLQQQQQQQQPLPAAPAAPKVPKQA